VFPFQEDIFNASKELSRSTKLILHQTGQSIKNDSIANSSYNYRKPLLTYFIIA